MLDDGVPTCSISDFNTTLTNILITYLSDESCYYGDIQCYDGERNEIKMVGCAVPPSLANKNGAQFAGHGLPTEGEEGGLMVDLVCKAGKGVLARISRMDGKFRLVVTKCEVKEPSDDEIEARRAECGIPFWPHAFITPLCDAGLLLKYWDSEYVCLGYGEHLYRQMIDFAEQCGMEVIAL